MSLVQAVAFGKASCSPQTESLNACRAPTGLVRIPVALEQHAKLVSGMIAQGHGIEVICFVLALAQGALLDLAVEQGLATPHTRPMRRTGGQHAWQQADYALLVAGWLQNWQAGFIAEQLGRSRGSVWSKARRLGFPRRDRRALVWPEPVPLPAKDLALPATVNAAPHLAITHPLQYRVRGTTEEIYITFKRNGREVEWVSPTHPHLLQQHLSLRRWSGQRPTKIAEDMGLSLRSVTSMLWWLQVPRLARALDTDVFDPELAKINIAKHGYREAKCLNPNYIFWQHRVRREKSRRDDRLGIC